MNKMGEIMAKFHKGLGSIAGQPIIKIDDYSKGLNGLPISDVVKYYFENGSVVVRPSGTEPKLKIYISIIAEDKNTASVIEKAILRDLSNNIG